MFDCSGELSKEVAEYLLASPRPDLQQFGQMRPITLGHPNLEEIDQATLRPGRIDHTIHVGELEADGYLRLVRSIIPAAKLAADVNYESVATAFAGLYPAFAAEAVRRDDLADGGSGAGAGAGVLGAAAAAAGDGKLASAAAFTGWINRLG